MIPTIAKPKLVIETDKQKNDPETPGRINKIRKEEKKRKKQSTGRSPTRIQPDIKSFLQKKKEEIQSSKVAKLSLNPGKLIQTSNQPLPPPLNHVQINPVTTGFPPPSTRVRTSKDVLGSAQQGEIFNCGDFQQPSLASTKAALEPTNQPRW